MNATMMHAAIEYSMLCRLLWPSTHDPVPASNTLTGSRAEVTCPECLVALDAIEERGVKFARTKWPWWGRSVRRNGQFRIGTRIWMKTARIRWRAPGVRESDFPWSPRSVKAKRDDIFGEQVRQPAPTFAPEVTP